MVRSGIRSRVHCLRFIGWLCLCASLIFMACDDPNVIREETITIFPVKEQIDVDEHQGFITLTINYTVRDSVGTIKFWSYLNKPIIGHVDLAYARDAIMLARREWKDDLAVSITYDKRGLFYYMKHISFINAAYLKEREGKEVR